ncbi:MAG: imidazole glycerol phosphate synthase subunit HisH [Candidatus Aminicenantes bacterium]|nr:imidazole glycerol phosphate synthase subunit HisH [Candidatus Aminicenantes bacterium]
MIGVVDYGAGNLGSVRNALDRAGLPSRPVATPEDLPGLSGLILPGVGSFGPAAAALDASGMTEGLRAWALSGRPLLGICLGLQLLFERSEEGEAGRPGLGLFAGRVVRLDGPRAVHIGWNRVRVVGPGPLAPPDEEPDWFYFVHGYVVRPDEEAIVAAVADYGCVFAAVVGRRNVWGVQFHPEKSGPAGLAVLRAWGASCSR